MGGRYPHMLLILILLHAANAALDEPVDKWKTLGGKHLTLVLALLEFQVENVVLSLDKAI
jgi:hypothetical protein